jgi:branched-chain amino acid transport system substrate-binding protein
MQIARVIVARLAPACVPPKLPVSLSKVPAQGTAMRYIGEIKPRKLERMQTQMPRMSVAAIVALALTALPALAQKKYDPGATDITIKIGNIAPYTGTFAAFGNDAKAEAAYYQMINDRGGVNGRKIEFISVDSGFDVPKTIELAHRLVEQDKVLLIAGSVGTPPNLAIRGYLNEKKIPQLFVASAADAFDDPSHFPWTMGFQATYHTEAAVYAQYLLRTRPNAKIGVLYADGDATEYLNGFRAGLGPSAATMIVKAVTFKYADGVPIDAQIAALKDSGADVFVNLAIGPTATKAIRTAYDMGWRPLQFIPNASLSIAAFIEPAGLAKSAGIITNARSKGLYDAASQRDPAVQEFLDWIKQYTPKGSERDAAYVYGYEVAQTVVEVLRKCGNDLTRANVMRQATNLDLTIGLLRPGIKITTSPTDYRPIKQLFLVQFNGTEWVALH